MSVKLKYCPFCNWTAEFEDTITEASVHCVNGLCRASIKVRKHFGSDREIKKMVIAMWNRRYKK